MFEAGSHGFSPGGVPFLPSDAWCVREWNRKNAAEINFRSGKVIEPGFQCLCRVAEVLFLRSFDELQRLSLSFC